MSTVSVSAGEVAASLVLVALAVAVSLWRRADLEQDLGLAVLRSFLQLTAIGYVIQAIFDSDSLWLVAGLLAIMVGIGTYTAGTRARAVPGAHGPIVLALGLAAAVTLGLVLALGVFEAEPRYLVPVGGMVIGNAMTATAVALNRLADEVRGSARQIEANARPRARARDRPPRGIVTRSLRSGMIPLIDQTKTTGIVAFPGTMVGMLVAGAEPVDAVRLQLILLWVLLGAVALAALVAVSLGYRGFFTSAHQLREPRYSGSPVTEAAPPPLMPSTPRLVKPRLRGVSHQWAFFVSCAIGAALVLAAPAGTPRLAAAIYAVSVSALFGVSALYHRITWASVNARRWMRRVDHSAIFVLIAGTYTPFALLILDGALSTVILIVVWAGALGGILLKLVWIDAPQAAGRHRLRGARLGRRRGVPGPARRARRDRHGARGRRRAPLHRGRARLRAEAPGSGADRLRLPRGVPRARDRGGRAPVRGGRVLRAAERLTPLVLHRFQPPRH